MEELERFLQAHDAGTISHPGGTLLAHLQRTSQRLRNWGADEELQTLGLAHATYGTDGFGVQLIDLDHRAELAAIVGEQVEQQVYLYASCDRRATYPHLADRPTVLFTDRFAGQQRRLPAADLRRFAELTAANELDVALHVPGFTDKHGSWLLGLLNAMRDLLTPAAWTDSHHALTNDLSTGHKTNTGPETRH